jgi:DNA-binding transcriptional MerR regulator
MCDRVFTTGKIAKICSVSTRTVCKWIDNGILKGRRIPGGLDRRVDEVELIAFLERHGMPLGDLLAPAAA